MAVCVRSARSVKRTKHEHKFTLCLHIIHAFKGKCGAEGGGMRRAAKISPWLRRAACKIRILFQDFVHRRRNHCHHFSGCDCGCLLSIYFWCRRVATGQSLLSYPSSANQIPHTTPHPFNHPCTSVHLQMQHFRLSRLVVVFPLPFFFFPLPFSVQRLSIIFGGIVRSSVIRVYH